METGSPREIVVEIEHTRLIRKRACTTVRFCRECKRSTDFLSLAKAAELFEVTTLTLFEFAQSSSRHLVVESDGEIHICLADLLPAMSKRMKTKSFNLLGEKK